MDEPVPGPFALWSLRPLKHALLAQRAASIDEPLLPRLWGLRFLGGVDQELPTYRAAVILGFQHLQGVAVQRRGSAPAATLTPESSQGRDVRGRPPPGPDHGDDLGPGALGGGWRRFG